MRKIFWCIKLHSNDNDVVYKSVLYLKCCMYFRPGSNAKKDCPSADQILSHLDHMRQICRNISCKYFVFSAINGSTRDEWYCFFSRNQSV